MKFHKITLISFAVFFAAVSCVGDLDVKPIDPSVTLPDEVLNSEQAYAQVLAKCYAGLTVSSSDGPDGSPDIDGIDGGFGQYMRALFYMNELPTDEALMCWNDQTVANLHNLCWTSTDVFVTAMFSRIYFQIQLCNEFIRRASASEFAGSDNMKTYIAEARALRALNYYHAIDMFGNVPFATEANSVGSTGPDRIAREDLFKWLDDECVALIGEGHLKAARSNVYGRLDVNFVKMVRAHLNLNATVYLGISQTEAKPYYDVVGTLCKEIRADYPALHAKYTDLFGADNDRMTDEIIFGVEQDGTDIQTYGGSNFILKASCKGKDKVVAAALGIDDGWGGVLVTPEFINSFDGNDTRKLFWGEGMRTDTPNDIADFKDFTTGWSAHKFTNINSDGSTPSVVNFVSTDVPLFRAADAYLMLAEAYLRGASTVSETEARTVWNAVRARAGLGNVADFTLDGILRERGHELYWECWRRSDLIRFDKLTTGDYLWAWKGGVKAGQKVDAKFNLMPIPASEANSNKKLTQNPGY